MLRRLEKAQETLKQARESIKNAPPRRRPPAKFVDGVLQEEEPVVEVEEVVSDLLDDAVTRGWEFGEYAINVVLELGNDNVEQHHKQAERARELYASKWLSQDYSARLEDLRQYRLKANYAGYSSAPSVHYSTKDVENCLVALEALKAEVEALLRKAGKLQ